jgi:ribosomal subunit interface protein
MKEQTGMQLPVQVTFRDVPMSDAVEAACWKEAERLERYFDRIMGCRVVISAPHRQHNKGTLYSVRVDLTVPGSELVVNRGQHDQHAREDVYVAIRDAFQKARRQLEDHARRNRGQTKYHEPPAHGRIRELHPAGGCGLIESPDGREVYFHRNAVLNDAFEQLELGSQVRFVEEPGEKGPQATSVALLGRHHHFVG